MQNKAPFNIERYYWDNLSSGTRWITSNFEKYVINKGTEISAITTNPEKYVVNDKQPKQLAPNRPPKSRTPTGKTQKRKK